jgi:nucleotide-binding universal stress UspA family protein
MNRVNPAVSLPCEWQHAATVARCIERLARDVQRTGRCDASSLRSTPLRERRSSSTRRSTSPSSTACPNHGSDPLGPKLVADANHDLAELAARAKSAGVDASIDVVVSSEPWRAIIDAAAARDVDAIVIGSHGFHAIDRLLGTNAARVADRARCLVVVVHEPRTTS